MHTFPPVARLCLALTLALTAVAMPAAAQESPPETAATHSVYLPFLAQPSSTQSGRPVIQSFTASPASISPDGAATLRWSVTGAAAVSISPGVGSVSGGSVEVRPGATTSYTLTATNSAGSVSAQATVVVETSVPGANPLTISAAPDSARAASAEVGPEGGELSATAANGVVYRLSLPAGALAYTETIRLVPAAATGLPFAAGSLGAVAIEPAELFLAEPATLTIEGAAAAPAGARPIGYSYMGAGSEFHLIAPAAPAAELVASAAGPTSVTLPVQLLRGYGASAGTAAEISAQATTRLPSGAIERAEQDVAADLDAEVVARMRAEFVDSVLPLMRSAQTNASLADRAIERWGRWRGFVVRHGYVDQMRDEIATGIGSLVAILENATRRSSGRCLDEGRVEEAFALLRWLNYTRRYLPGTPITEIQAALERCLRFEVTFKSVIEASHPAEYGFRYEVKSTIPLRWAGGMRLTGAAQLDFVAMDWFGGTTCRWDATRVGSYFEARDPGQGLLISPVSRTSPDTRATFTYDPGSPSERVTLNCDGAVVPLPETFGWKTYYGDLHADERSPEGYTSVKNHAGAARFSWHYLEEGVIGTNDMRLTENTTIHVVHTPAR